MTKRPRAVFDTNVFVSASLSKNVNSPTRELLERWKKKEFTLVICDQSHSIFGCIEEAMITSLRGGRSSRRSNPLHIAGDCFANERLAMTE